MLRCVAVFRPVWELCLSLTSEHSRYSTITCARVRGSEITRIQKYFFSSKTSCGTSELFWSFSLRGGEHSAVPWLLFTWAEGEGGYCSLCIPEVRFPFHSRHPCVCLKLFALLSVTWCSRSLVLFLLASSFILTRVEREREEE